MQPTVEQQRTVLQFLSRGVGELMCSSCSGWGRGEERDVDLHFLQDTTV